MLQIETKRLQWNGFTEYFPFKNFETAEQLKEFYELLPNDLKDHIVKYGFDDSQDELFKYLLHNQLKLTTEKYYMIWDVISYLKEEVSKHSELTKNRDLLNFFLYGVKFDIDFKKLRNDKS